MALPPVRFESEKVQDAIAYVLDDDGEICALVSRMLQAAGYVAIPFTDPAVFLKQLKTTDDYNTPKIVVLDLSLGRTDGIEVLNELKSAKYKGNVLLISGKDESALHEIERMGVARGLMMLLSLKKPFRKDDLVKRLAIELAPAKPAQIEPPVSNSAVALDRAISSRRLAHRYQSIIDLKSGLASGAEVMLYERLPSNELIPLTTPSLPSSAPIFHPLARLLLRITLDDWRRHLAELSSPMRLYMKLPLAVVTTVGFLTLLREALAPHPKFPGFVIEVNDWRQFNDLKAIREASAQLKLYGVRLAIADIAAVYSAITESYKFPFSEYRLTANFTSNCALNETKRALCRDAINLAHDAGATVCAEGVVNSDELETLVEMKCDKAQGFLFGTPRSMDVFKTNLLAATIRQKVNANPGSFEWPEAANAT